jgi:hypothetical protein
MAESLPPRALIAQVLKEKSVLKQEVYHIGKLAFGSFREAIHQLVDGLSLELKGKTSYPLKLNAVNRGDGETVATIAGDTLIFQLHTNIFQFERSHAVWQTGYLREDQTRSYCAVINVYNFLTDSILFNRDGDIGYLIARIFINKDQHYFVEGKRQLGFLYNQFHQAKLTPEEAQKVVESTILYTLDFDLLVPQYDQVKLVTISDIQATSSLLVQRTGKRLGFHFSADI